MVICWIYQNVQKKRTKALANNPDAEYTLLTVIKEQQRLLEDKGLQKTTAQYVKMVKKRDDRVAFLEDSLQLNSNKKV